MRIQQLRPLFCILSLGVITCSALLARQSDPSTAANDPNSEHLPGIYCYQNGQMTLLTSVPANTKTSGGMKTAISYGIAKTNSKISVDGVHATTQISGPAIFYFYFEKQQSGFGLSGAPSSTDQFKLLRFEVKKSSREAVVMQSNGFGSSTGVPGKDAVPFSSTKLENGGFKVSVNLPPAEYCFINAGALTVFDFAVVDKK